MAATRLYFPSSTSAPAPPVGVTPAPAPLWDQAATTYRALTTQAQAGTSTGNNVNFPTRTVALGTTATICGGSFVSLSTFQYARTVSGTVSHVGSYFESSASADEYVLVVVRVVSSDGTVVRGTLLNGATNNTEISNINSSRSFTDVALSPVAVQAGDRLVVELGSRSLNTATVLGAAGLRMFSNSAAGDLPLSDGSGSTTLRSWIEFSDDLFGLPTISGTATLGLPRFGATLAGARTLPTTGTLATGLRPLSATLAGTARPLGISGPLTLQRPAMRAGVAGTSTPPPRTATVAAATPSFALALQGFAPLAVTGSIAADLSPFGATLHGNVAGKFETLVVELPAFSLAIEASVPVVYGTDLTFGNDGYSYRGEADIEYEPHVADAPPHLQRQDVRRIHVSLPTPTLMKGRPQ